MVLNLFGEQIEDCVYELSTFVLSAGGNSSEFWFLIHQAVNDTRQTILHELNDVKAAIGELSLGIFVKL